MNMSEEFKAIFLEDAEECGWFNERISKIAKNFLTLGRPVEEVADATGLPIETVRSLAQA
jgi:predicted transposase YdaD